MDNQLQPKRPSDSCVTLTVLMGTQDSNNLGNVHGGVIMKLCDEAGAMAALKHARNTVVTVVVDRMSFDAPVQLGELVTFEAEVTWVGRTSIESRILVRAENMITGEITHTNRAYFLYVSIDGEGRPVPVPALLCESEDEKQRYEEALERQKIRLQLRQLESRRST